jgi:Fur family peroxide stress response transcriptional regulator
MSSSVTTLIDALRRAGHRITPQRRAICQYLATVTGHPSPSEVYAGVSAVTPTISRATVYNTLNALAAAGALLQIDLGDEHTHYETNRAPHINLVCRRCHQVTDFEMADLSGEIIAALKHAVHFAPSTVHVQVFGLCAACQHVKD